MSNEILKTEPLTLQTVKRAVYSWNIRFPEGQRPQSILDFLASEYHEDLESESVTNDEFARACKIARKKCTFFPKVADILAAIGSERAKVGGHEF